jgi:ABC-type transport system involved in cytochrome bd biosynthesis fused ATPase/permease subunit
MARISGTWIFTGMDETSDIVGVLLTSCSLRAQIGVVPQAPILFDDTIMNNVRYAKLTATDEEVYEACKAASIHDQILTFTDGGALSMLCEKQTDSKKAIKPRLANVASSSPAESCKG